MGESFAETVRKRVEAERSAGVEAPPADPPAKPKPKPKPKGKRSK